MTAITPADGHNPCISNESMRFAAVSRIPTSASGVPAPNGMAVTGGTVSRIAWGARLAGHRSRTPRW
jgi:hypothetical protein